MGDKGNYGAEAAMFGKWDRFANFKQWLNAFLTRHGLKPNDKYMYKLPSGEQVIIECINIIEVILSTHFSMHPQIKLMLEMKEKQGVDMKEWIGQMGIHFYLDGYFDRDPRFRKEKFRVNSGPLN